MGGSSVQVLGGEFTGCRSTGNGGFMYASDGALVRIRGGTVTNGVAERRAGVVSRLEANLETILVCTCRPSHLKKVALKTRRASCSTTYVSLGVGTLLVAEQCGANGVGLIGPGSGYSKL